MSSPGSWSPAAVSDVRCHRAAPAYQALRQQLRDEIAAGEYRDGARLPTESELVARHRRVAPDGAAGVSGSGRRGCGVPGARPRHVRDSESGRRYLRQLGSIEDLMSLSDDTTMEVPRACARRVDVEAASRLQSRDVVYTVTFRRLLDGVPFVVTTVHLPSPVGPARLDAAELRDGAVSTSTVIGLLEPHLAEPISRSGAIDHGGVGRRSRRPAVECLPGTSHAAGGPAVLGRDRPPVELAGQPLPARAVHLPGDAAPVRLAGTSARFVVGLAAVSAPNSHSSTERRRRDPNSSAVGRVDRTAPDSTKYAVRQRPMRRVMLTVPPAPGIRPRASSGRAKRCVCARTSHDHRTPPSPGRCPAPDRAPRRGRSRRPGGELVEDQRRGCTGCGQDGARGIDEGAELGQIASAAKRRAVSSEHDLGDRRVQQRDAERLEQCGAGVGGERIVALHGRLNRTDSTSRSRVGHARDRGALARLRRSAFSEPARELRLPTAASSKPATR